MYYPSEDSYFFKDFIKSYLKDKRIKKDYFILDMGCGSGILTRICSTFVPKTNLLSVDIQEECVNGLGKEGFNSIRSDLFKKIQKKRKFDMILFNAPYLPRNKLEDKKSQKETTGGEEGDEISLKFLRQSKCYLKKGGEIFLLISSLTPLKRIKKFNPEIVARKKIWFEELLILKFRKLLII